MAGRALDLDGRRGLEGPAIALLSELETTAGDDTEADAEDVV